MMTTGQLWIEPSPEMALVASGPPQGLVTENGDERLQHESYNVTKLDGSCNQLLSESSNSTLETLVDSSSSHSSLPSMNVDDRSPSAKPITKKCGVTFTTVRIHEHRLTLGDNPGVSLGVPLTLAWECDNSDTIDLETFERFRCDENNQKEASGRMPLMQRLCIASEHHSRESILRRTEEVLEIQKSRVESGYDRPEFMSQRVDRRVSKATSDAQEAKKKKDQETHKKKKSAAKVFTNWFRRS